MDVYVCMYVLKTDDYSLMFSFLVILARREHSSAPHPLQVITFGPSAFG
jgi:hypothetical protein